MSGKEHSFHIFLVLILILGFNLFQVESNKARYDNYRLYRFLLKTPEQVKIFQQIEAESDSYDFIGHAREPGQKLTIVVSAAKIAEIHDIIDRFQVEYQILVRSFSSPETRLKSSNQNYIPGPQPAKENRPGSGNHKASHYSWKRDGLGALFSSLNDLRLDGSTGQEIPGISQDFRSREEL
jgi:hypothetical protein